MRIERAAGQRSQTSGAAGDRPLQRLPVRMLEIVEADGDGPGNYYDRS